MNSYYGFNSSGFYDLQMAFSLANFRIYAGGVTTTTTALPNSSEFTALFDYYCIDRVDVTIMYSHSNSQMSNANYAVPIFYLVEDYDSAEATTLRNIQQYPAVTTHYMSENGGHVIRKTLRPRPLLVGLDGSTQVPQISGPTWIDTGTPDTLHYGLKLVWDPSARTNDLDAGSLNICVKYHLRFKAPR